MMSYWSDEYSVPYTPHNEPTIALFFKGLIERSLLEGEDLLEVTS